MPLDRIRRERRLVGLAVSTAIVVVACNGGPPPTSTPRPTSSAADLTASAATNPTPTPDRPEPLPAGVLGQWITSPHAIPALAPDANAALMTLRPTAFTYTARIEEHGGSEVLKSTGETRGDGTVRLVLRKDEAGCHAGAVGTYEMQPSSSGLSLAVKAVADDCPARVAAMTSATWSRLDCPHAPQWCLGAMEAGDHVSVNYEPFVRQPDWQPDYGRFGFTVPAGWMTSEDNADGYVLQPIGGAEGTGVYVFSDVLAHAQGKDCPERAATVGTSAPAIARWIESLAGLDVTNVDPHATVGGLSGRSFDLALKPGWTGTCAWADNEPLVELFVNAQTTPEDGFEWGINGKGRERLYVLALAPDRTLVIDIEAADSATWTALLPVAEPIVQSFSFRH